MIRLIEGPNINLTTDWDELWYSEARSRRRQWDKYRFLGMLSMLPGGYVIDSFGGKFLDACCGISELACWVKNTQPSAEIHGWDHSKFCMEYMSEYSPFVNWHKISIQNMLDGDVPVNDFDYVSNGETLEHFDDPEIVVQAMFNVAKVGAPVIFTTPWEDIHDDWHIWLIEESDLQKWLEPRCEPGTIEMSKVGPYWIAGGVKK